MGQKRMMSLSMLLIMVMTVCMVLIMTAGESYAASGLVKKGGYIYYYSGGKKVKSKTVTVNGVKYYFSKKGRGFVSLRNKKGNAAMSKVIDKVKFKAGWSKKKKLKACYKYIIRMSYTVVETPPTSKKGWYYGSAKDMAYRKQGKCYEFASLTAVCARAMGYKKVKLHYGKARERYTSNGAHCWVTIKDKVLDASYDNSYNKYHGGSKLLFFFRTYDDIRKKNGNSPDGRRNYSVRYTDKYIYTLK